MKLISLNVWGDHMTAEQIAFFQKERPDVICMQELFAVDIPVYEKALGMKSVFTPLTHINVENKFNDAPRGAWGVGIFSTFPLKNTNVKFYQYESAKESPFPEHGGPDHCARALLWTDVVMGEETYTIATTHFTWTNTEQPTPLQFASLEKLLNILETIPHFVLTGDFNAPRGYAIFDTLAKKYTDNIPVSVKTTIDQHIHRVQGLQLVIDALFSTAHYNVEHVRVVDGVSDHQAVIADISVQKAV